MGIPSALLPWAGYRFWLDRMLYYAPTYIESYEGLVPNHSGINRLVIDPNDYLLELSTQLHGGLDSVE